MSFNLSKVEKEILDLKLEKKTNEPLSFPSPISSFVAQSREDELNFLETKRQFILDRRENLFWKFIWNVLVPIFVTLVTTFFISKFNLF
jgi:hypothetical protein